MNKICTSLEQSKKLLKLGIDISTADMFYRNNGEDVKLMWEHLSDVEVTSPAWSLGALLKILSDITDYSFELVFLKHTTDGRGDVLENVYRCSVDMKDIYNTEHLDAIFEMIVWLKENGKL